MSLAPQIIGTLKGIPRALALDETSLDDLYAVAEVLQEIRNGVLDEALRVVALEEGYRLITEYRRAAFRTDGGPAA